MVYYVSFFLLLNFFPNNYKFDQYYSAPRIFRYLAPLSFPMSLHVGKMLLDLTGLWPFGVRAYNVAGIVVGPFLLLNFYHAHEATCPSLNPFFSGD